MDLETLLKKYIKDEKSRDAFIKEATKHDLVFGKSLPLDFEKLYLNNTHCSICGKPLTVLDMYGGYSFSKYIGFGSAYDLSNFSCDLCAKCFDKVLDTILPLFKKEFPLSPVFIDDGTHEITEADIKAAKDNLIWTANKRTKGEKNEK